LISDPPTAAEWQYCKNFHGHIGPWLSLGMRLGVAAMERTSARSHFGVTVDIRCPPAPPHSCLIDGLQLSTGATYGKQNIAAGASSTIDVVVVNKDTGVRFKADVLASTEAVFSQWFGDLGEEEAARRVWAVPLDTLCEIEEESGARNPG
jgi:formylmethanofuran dehydrogenase subunit E